MSNVFRLMVSDFFHGADRRNGAIEFTAHNGESNITTLSAYIARNGRLVIPGVSAIQDGHRVRATSFNWSGGIVVPGTGDRVLIELSKCFHRVMFSD